METHPTCPNCRKPLPPDVPLGLCPECLIKSGFPTGTEPGVPGEVAGARFVPPPVEEIARLFPQLEILGFIGKGGMGAVYKARQPALDRFVALKVLPPAVAGDPGFAERFNREARALARLNHPNIVAVHDFGKAGPLHYLVMEFVDGANLREVEQAGKLSTEQALAIVPQICEALQFAHNEGIVHRDIKPENLLMDKKGRVKITDFGIAKIVGVTAGKSALTGVKDVVGTPHYMAPEQVEKPQEVDHRADIYSLGVVFYEMLTGELPLGKFAPPSKKVQIDVRLDEVVLHTLEKEPARRYQQVNHLKTDVETISGTGPSAAGFAAKGGSVPLLASQSDKTTSDKAILPALLLAFPFGLFGAHRFYVGKIQTGLLQLGGFGLCIFLIIACAVAGGGSQPTLGILLGFSIFGCVIWAIIDWILIVCKGFTDGQGKRIAHWTHPQNGDLKTGTRPLTGQPPTPPPGGTVPPNPANPVPLSPIPDRAPAGNTGKIVAPAVGLMVAGSLKLLGVFSNTTLFLPPSGRHWLNQIAGGNFFGGSNSAFIGGGMFFELILALLILFGAFQMLRLRCYAWAVAASILAILSCGVVSLIMGVWALIILARQDVRETFANAAASHAPQTGGKWPWILGAAAVAGVLVIGLIVASVLALRAINANPNVTVRGTVTDAVTGKPIPSARVDDNRYGADADKAPQQAWTDRSGHYKLQTWNEEHTIAASASGYETEMSTLLTKAFDFEREQRMDFKLRPTRANASATNGDSGSALNLSSQNGKVVIETTKGTLTADKVKLETSGNGELTMTAQKLNYPVRPVPLPLPIRIKAGSSRSFTDSEGNLWLGDQGFTGGQTLERSGDLAIANTKDPTLYRTERYSMTSFSYPVPNGKYVVKLHFAETYDVIKGPGERVFTFIVEGHEFRDFDVWDKAGGAQRACVETVNVEVTDGRLNIYFIPQTENPQINGIEILPASPVPTTLSVLPALPVAAVVMPPPTPPAGSSVTVPPRPDPTPTPAKSHSHRARIPGTLTTTDPIREDFNQTLPLSANGRFRIDNVNGRVEITGGDRNDVVIKALKHGKTRETVDAVKIKINSSPDEISIHTELPPNSSDFSWIWSWFKNGGNNNANVDYVIQVPERTRLANVSSVNGNVVIQGVAGDIAASTVNGQLQVLDAAGDLKLSTVNGGIDARFDVLGRGQFVSFNTVNGGIEATLPANADATVSANTVNGGLSSEFPALRVKNEFPVSKKLNGILDHGGATVKAGTVNGGIHFRKGTDNP